MFRPKVDFNLATKESLKGSSYIWCIIIGLSQFETSECVGKQKGIEKKASRTWEIAI